MIVIAVISILTAIAYPVYTQHMTKARRSEAQIALLNLAASMERYAAIKNGSYEGATLSELGVAATTAHGFYTLAIAQTSASGYELQAIPNAVQAHNDILCKTLMIDQRGRKQQMGLGTMQECWG